MKFIAIRQRMLAGIAAAVVGALSGAAFGGEGEEAAATTNASPDAEAAVEAPKPQIDIRKLFATNCSWCHDGYGMHAGKGPKLAGTAMTEQQVYKRIAKGKSGAMPGFEKTLSKEQIQALAEYIKGLKDPDS
jgi:mono/diheme cytochrome c family protein